MKLLSRGKVALYILLGLFWMCPVVVSAEENDQLSKAHQNEYEQMMPGEHYELEIGETRIIGTTEEGGILAVTCLGDDSDIALLSAERKVSTRAYKFTETTLGITYTLYWVHVTCVWYADGIDGYIESFDGTYTVESPFYSCAWNME